MLLRRLLVTLVGCTLLAAPLAAREPSAPRGPSTSEERAKALAIIQDNEENPLGSKARDQRKWLVSWLAQIPDITVNACLIFDGIAAPGKKDSDLVFGQTVFAQAAFVMQHPDKKSNLLAQYQAGVEGALRLYENLLKSKPKDRQPYLDNLLQRRAAGTLAEFVKERVSASCDQEDSFAH